MATKGLLIVLVISVKDAQITETLASAQSSILTENDYVSLVLKEKDITRLNIRCLSLTWLYL